MPASNDSGKMGLAPENGEKQVKIYMDGCFDMMHCGHANAIRQAKEMGHYLCVGAHSDGYRLGKRPPVYSEQERYKLLRAVKWVDEVVEAAPGILTLEAFEKIGCDFCVHGDDVPWRPDGLHWYHVLKSVGKYKEYKRTVGISTSDLIARILSRTRNEHHQEQNGFATTAQGEQNGLSEAEETSSYLDDSQFLMTTQYILQFAEKKSPQPGDKIVYVCGAFDLFNVGHLGFLEKVAAEGQFVLVGIHSDQDVKRYKGSPYPIQTLNERVLNVLAYRYVSDVVIGASYEVTAQLMDHFKVDLVCHGKTPARTSSDPYAEAKKQGKFKIIDSGNSLTTEMVVQRVVKNRKILEEDWTKDKEYAKNRWNEYMRTKGLQD